MLAYVLILNLSAFFVQFGEGVNIFVQTNHKLPTAALEHPSLSVQTFCKFTVESSSSCCACKLMTEQTKSYCNIYHCINGGAS